LSWHFVFVCFYLTPGKNAYQTQTEFAVASKKAAAAREADEDSAKKKS
jgi:hypothetical protein